MDFASITETERGVLLLFSDMVNAPSELTECHLIEPMGTCSLERYLPSNRTCEANHLPASLVLLVDGYFGYARRLSTVALYKHLAALINFRFMANAVWTTDEAVKRMQQ